MNPQHLTANLPLRDTHAQQQLNPQNNWNPQMNVHQQQMLNQQQFPMGMQQDQMQFQPQSWLNQQNQSTNGINPLGGFTMNYLSPQVLQDAIALSVPVGPEDESLLVKHILDGLKRGENYKVILNGLHGKNDHSASLWKDYYLEHKERIDAWINMCQQKGSSASSTPIEPPKHKERTPSISAPIRNGQPQPTIKAPTIKKPSPSAFRVSSATPSGSATPSVPLKKPKKAPSPDRTTPQALAQAAGSRRSTINSLTVSSPVFNRHLPPPHAEIKIPPPPSRSPSPPTIIIPKGRGHKYTDQDHEFFIKFIQWRLKDNPELTRTQLCDMLGEKAPHHTAQSWASYWHLNHDLPDKILAAARESTYVDDVNDAVSSEESPPTRKRPRYRDDTTTEEDDSSSEEEAPRRRASNKRRVEVKVEEGSDDDTPVRVWKEHQMGQKGGSFTEADMYITAKYIADFPNWGATMSKDRWGPYARKYPQRSEKAWREYYRRYETEIDRLVHKIKKEERRKKSSR
ncbi:hypothetical protein CC1G_01739 [Coprinopsis cinerea okayama7|uniref:Uncharacterized protein n=1 Tax=Coprinopsis cinerea (strain Okayama-7 / 130 / ATCC MYA-4618 / FGSC 9003) TaxID=240176 RepID=A8N2M2_COPC7|nr:hypothetical protein CC1G_01739 [Coprinopsis cinerea okayama7\|eukprot:XP_001829059.2 hypothetical protein CC1G_01739 [Coprinopsis cinerea okayama7\